MSSVNSVEISGLESGTSQSPCDDTQSGMLSRAGVIGGRSKRALDLLIAGLALLILLPLVILVALAVKLSSPGPVLYGHQRIGHGGKTFRCWKFRSMVPDGAAILEAYFEADPKAREIWNTDRKLQNDPRVTRIGAVLRAFSIDELPQLLNVLKGEMSIVGPRPVVQEELDTYGGAAALYLRTRPGITGLWQVSGRSDLGFRQRITLDADYVTNWSLSLDMTIILRTVPVVISAKGSY